MSKTRKLIEKFWIAKVRLKSRFPETLKNPAILMGLVSVYFPHICVSNAENRRLIAASVLEIFKKYSRSSYFAVDSNILPVDFIQNT